MSTDLIPAADATYALGTSSVRWKDAFLSDTLELDSLTASQAVVSNGSKQLSSLSYTSDFAFNNLVSRDGDGNSEFGQVKVTEIDGYEFNNIAIISQQDIALSASESHAIAHVINGDTIVAITTDEVDVNSLLVAPTAQITDDTDATSYLDAPLVCLGGFGVGGKSYLNGGIMLPTSGGTAALLDANESGSISNNWGGAISSTSGPIYYSKVGKSVSISWAELSHLGNGSTTAISSTSGVIPSRFRPIHDMERTVMVQNNGNWGLGHVRVLASGTIQFFASNPSGSYNGSGQHFIPGECFSYPVS